MVQWLRLCSSFAGDLGSIPGQGTKIPCAVWWWGRGVFKKNEKGGIVSEDSLVFQ